jgi:hypothetical protein
MWVRPARRTFVMCQGMLAMVLAVAGTAASAETRAAAMGFASASGATIIGFGPAISDADRADLDAVLRDHFDLPPSARPLVERMWQASPTFRRQCRRLAEALATVTIRLDFPQLKGRSNAETVITRGPRIRAHVRLRAADPHATQYLAHELEHILEQIDGVDLPGAVAGGVSGASRLDNAIYETARAVAVGRRVANEVERFRK